MPAAPVAFSSTLAGTVQVIAANRPGRIGASVANGSTGTNTLYITVGSTTLAPSSTSHTAQISPGSYFETPWFYRGEPITAAWASSSSGYGFITVYP